MHRCMVMQTHRYTDTLVRRHSQIHIYIYRCTSTQYTDTVTYIGTQIPRYRDTQIHSFTDKATQITSYTDTQIDRYIYIHICVDICKYILHRYTDTHIQRHIHIYICIYIYTLVHRYTATQIHRYTATQTHRYTATQIHRYTDAQMDKHIYMHICFTDARYTCT